MGCTAFAWLTSSERRRNLKTGTVTMILRSRSATYEPCATHFNA